MPEVVHRIRMPDGSVHQVRFPSEPSQQDIDKAARSLASNLGFDKPQQKAQPSVPKGVESFVMDSVGKMFGQPERLNFDQILGKIPKVDHKVATGAAKVGKAVGGATKGGKRSTVLATPEELAEYKTRQAPVSGTKPTQSDLSKHMPTDEQLVQAIMGEATMAAQQGRKPRTADQIRMMLARHNFEQSLAAQEQAQVRNVQDVRAIDAGIDDPRHLAALNRQVNPEGTRPVPVSPAHAQQITAEAADWKKGLSKIYEGLGDTVTLGALKAAPILMGMPNADRVNREFQSYISEAIGKYGPEAVVPLNPVLFAEGVIKAAEGGDGAQPIIDILAAAAPGLFKAAKAGVKKGSEVVANIKANDPLAWIDDAQVVEPPKTHAAPPKVPTTKVNEPGVSTGGRRTRTESPTVKATEPVQTPKQPEPVKTPTKAPVAPTPEAKPVTITKSMPRGMKPRVKVTSAADPIPAPKPKTTGLANQVQKKEAEILGEIEATKGKSAAEWQKIGKEKVEAENTDFEGMAQRILRGEEELTGEKVGILLEGKRQLLNEVNKAKAALTGAPGDKHLLRAYDEAQDRLTSYVEAVQAGKGRWSDVGRALQAGTELDTGNFAQVLEEVSRGGKVSKGLEKKLQDMTNQVAERDAKIAALEQQAKDAQAERVVTNTRTRRFDKASVQAEIDDIFEQFKTIKPTAGVKGKQGGAVSLGKQDFANLGKRTQLVGRLAKAYVKLGASTLEEVIVQVQKAVKDRLGITLSRQEIIDAMAVTEPRTRSELQKTLAQVKQEARRESSAAKRVKDAKERARYAKKVDDLKKQIADLENQIKTGNFSVKTPKEVRVTKELEDLRAQRDMWAGRVRGQINQARKSRIQKGAQAVGGLVRGTILGSDIGVLTRQGLFAWSRPMSALRSLGKAAKNVFSEANFQKWQRGMDERRVGGQLMQPIQKKAGLSLSNTLTDPEELSFARLIKKVPVIGEIVGGSLERFQHTFINSVRADLFDYAYMRGYTPEELARRAQFINNATGRGNFTKVPSDLTQFIFTSPRYEKSRWAMIGETLSNPAQFAADLAKGKVNKATLANMQDLALTAAEIWTLFKAAELAGYSVDFDPTSSDFLKMRKGNEVWDPTAGIAPRLRDATRAVVYTLDPKYGKDLGGVIGDASTRAFSPAFKQPVEIVSTQYQKRVLGKTGEDIKSPFTGFESDVAREGWISFMPLIVQSVRESWQKEGLGTAVWTGAREFVGQSVNRYPKKN